MISRCPKKVPVKATSDDVIVTQERDISMYNTINQLYNDSTFYIAILGRSHVLRDEAHMVKRFQGKFKNVTTLLQTDRASHFRRQTISLVFFPVSRSITSISPKGEIKILKPIFLYPGHFAEHKDYLNSLLSTDNITFLNLRETKLRNARRYADYMIVIRQATGIY
jgi:hypothetical protein